MAPGGEDAAFSAAIPFTGYDNNGHSEVVRYDAPGDELACASCNPTNARATGDARLATNGLSLTDDGRVFFNTTDALAPRDLDNKVDAYEWADGTVSLISTGISCFDSSLLGVSADGTDAYFFTRDVLVPQDHNRELVKIYDARELGGFPNLPPPVPCKASDECHGAGTEAPAPANVNSLAGTKGNEKSAKLAKKPNKCKHGRAKKRHGKRCAKKHRRRTGRGDPDEAAGNHGRACGDGDVADPGRPGAGDADDRILLDELDREPGRWPSGHRHDLRTRRPGRTGGG